MTRSEVLKNAYVLARNQRATAHRELGDAEMEVRRHRKNLDHYKDIEDGLKEFVCQGCMGYGYVQVTYDQDDVKSEKCKSCAGTGLPSGT